MYFFLNIQNNATGSRELYPEQGTAIVDNQEINLAEVSVSVTNLRRLREPMSPDSEHRMAFWFGVPQGAWNDISSIQYRLAAPLDENGNSTGDDYFFDIAVSNWDYAPLPEELQPFLEDLRVDL